MTRDYFQDIMPSENEPASNHVPETPQRSIRNITPSSRPRSSRPMMQEVPGSHREPHPPRRSKRSPMLWILLLLALIGIGFIASTLFRKTTITVTPRQQTVVFDRQATYTAVPEGENAPEGRLIYTTDARSFEDSVPVETSGTEQVSVASSGTITIYNAYSTAPSRLIKNTRFETPDGKIFRIRDSVVIPGKSGTKPGSITARVYADEPGADYNIGPVEKFTVPGLKSTPDMYAGIYARSESPMTGGFVGERPSVTEAARAAATAQLTTNLEALIAAAYTDTAETYPVIALAQISYSPLAFDMNADGTATARQEASVVMPLLSRDAVDSFLATETSASTGSEEVSIIDPSTFSFVTSEDSTKVPQLGTDPIDFALSGNVVFVWDIDAATLAADLAGKNKATFQAIVGGYPSIDSASAKVYPLWNQTFPNEPAAIRVIITPAQSSI